MAAVAMTLLEIGDAVKSLGDATSAGPANKWRQITGMRDVLAHHYACAQSRVVHDVYGLNSSPTSVGSGIKPVRYILPA